MSAITFGILPATVTQLMCKTVNAEKCTLTREISQPFEVLQNLLFE